MNMNNSKFPFFIHCACMFALNYELILLLLITLKTLMICFCLIYIYDYKHASISETRSWCSCFLFIQTGCTRGGEVHCTSILLPNQNRGKNIIINAETMNEIIMPKHKLIFENV